MRREESLIKPLEKLTDITKSKRAEVDKQPCVALFDLANDAIVVHDLGDRILYWNQAAEILYGYTSKEAVGRCAHELLSRDECAKFTDGEKALHENGEWHGELEQRTKDNLKIVVDSRKTLIRDEWGTPKSILLINTDKSEKKQLEAQYFKSSENGRHWCLGWWNSP